MKKSVILLLIPLLILFSCQRDTEEITNEGEDSNIVAINVMKYHPWDEQVLARLSATDPNGFEGATPSVYTTSMGLRSTMDNVKLTGGGSYDMEVFNNLQIRAATGSLQIQLGYCRNYNTTQPFQESHSSIPNWPIPTIINGQSIGWKTGKKSTYTIYKVYNSDSTPTTKWRTNIDGTDILEYETFDVNSYAVSQTCGTGIFTTGTGRFPHVNWYPALEIWDGKSWVQVPSAREIYCASLVGIESNQFCGLDTGTDVLKQCGIILW